MSRDDTIHRQRKSSAQYPTTSKNLTEEKTETQDARKALWRATELWDRDYTSCKFVTRGLLRHLGRNQDISNFFLDLSANWKMGVKKTNTEPRPTPTN